MDAFTYTVRDNTGTTSNVATVNISVVLNPLPWQNPQKPLDVSNDSFVSPIDALLIINDLKFHGIRKLPNPPQAPLLPPPYLDVSGDGFVSPADALLIINALNGGSGEGEGESVELVVSGAGLLSSSWPTDTLRPTNGRGLLSGPGTTPVAETAAPRGSSAPADYGLTIGQASTARYAALRDGLTSPADEDVMELIAADVAGVWDNDVVEDQSLIDALLGNEPRGKAGH